MEAQPIPPLFPPLISRPLNLSQDDTYSFMLNKKKNFRAQMKGSFYYVDRAPSEKSEFNALIERYSDKYTKAKKVDDNKWQPNWSYFPRELKFFYEQEAKVKVKRKSTAKPNLVKRKAKGKIDLSKLEEMEDENEAENAEENAEKKANKEKESDNEENENQDELDALEEEDEEEENDYIDTYFDNGENYGDDEYGGGGGGDDEGPVY